MTGNVYALRSMLGEHTEITAKFFMRPSASGRGR